MLFLALTPMSADENKDTIYLSFVFHFLTNFSKKFMEKLWAKLIIFPKLEVSYIVSLNVAKTYANLLKAVLRKRFNSHEVGLG